MNPLRVLALLTRVAAEWDTGRERAVAAAELRRLAGLATHRGIALLLAGLAELMAPE